MMWYFIFFFLTCGWAGGPHRRVSVAGMVPPRPVDKPVIGGASPELRVGSAGAAGGGLRERGIRIRGDVVIEEEDVDPLPVAMAVFPMRHARNVDGAARAGRWTEAGT